ncbi:MAG: hypothetical protein RL411_933 [Bacteroidota bacterium]
MDRWQSGLMLRFTKPPMVLETIRGFESFSVRFWKVVRVVEGAALEMLCARKCTVGSNPTSSVIHIDATPIQRFIRLKF